MNQHSHEQLSREQLSALMDGELSRDELRFLLNRAGNDAELPSQWARYQIIRQALRRQEVMIAPGFAAGVMAQLEHVKHDEQPVVRRPARAIHHQWLHWGVSGVIAASVAVVALMLTRPIAVDAPSPQRSAARDDQIAAAPIAATTATATTHSEFRTPLPFAPDPSVTTAPVSFGTGPVQPAATGQAQPYLIIRPIQAAGSDSGPADFVPYILLGSQRLGSAPAAAAAAAQKH